MKMRLKSTYFINCSFCWDLGLLDSFTNDFLVLLWREDHWLLKLGCLHRSYLLGWNCIARLYSRTCGTWLGCRRWTVCRYLWPLLNDCTRVVWQNARLRDSEFPLSKACIPCTSWMHDRRLNMLDCALRWERVLMIVREWSLRCFSH